MFGASRRAAALPKGRKGCSPASQWYLRSNGAAQMKGISCCLHTRVQIESPTGQGRGYFWAVMCGEVHGWWGTASTASPDGTSQLLGTISTRWNCAGIRFHVNEEKKNSSRFFLKVIISVVTFTRMRIVYNLSTGAAQAGGSWCE